MLSAFVSIPAVKMDWITFGIKTTGVVLAKMAANAVVPGLGAAVDFAQAANDLRHGDKLGAVINTASGVVDICTLGLSSSIQGAMKESAKKSTKEGAKVLGKKAGKEATKKFGRQVGRLVASGSLGKEVADKYASAWAHQVRKKATKEFGEWLGKDIAQGLISESVEKVFKEGTKKAAGGLLEDFCLKLLSTGGKDVANHICEAYFENGIQLVISQAMKQNPKLAFVFAKIAEEGALKEFEKHISKLMTKDVTVACAKAAINFSANGYEPTAEDKHAMLIAIEIISLLLRAK